MKSELGLRRLVSGGSVLAAGAFVQAGLGLIAQLILMRLLLPEEFGEFVVVLALCGVIQMVLSLRLNVQIIRVPDDQMTPARHDSYRAALVWESAASALVTLLWLAWTGMLTPLALLLVGALMLGQWSNQNVAFYERGMAYGRIVMVETGSQILGHALAVALVLTGFGAAALYLREMAVAMTRVVAFAWIGALSKPLWRWLGWSDWCRLIREARGLWVDGLLESGLARFIVLGTAATGSTHGVGIFAQSQRLATIPHQLMAPAVIRLSANLFSRLTDDTRRRALLVRLTMASLAALAIAAAVMVVLAEPVIPPLLGKHWRPATQVVIAMAGIVLFYSPFELLRSYCISRHRMHLVLVARLVQYGVFLVALLLARTADDPILTLAWGVSATYALSFLVLATALARRH